MKIKNLIAFAALALGAFALPHGAFAAGDVNGDIRSLDAVDSRSVIFPNGTKPLRAGEEFYVLVRLLNQDYGEGDESHPWVFIPSTTSLDSKYLTSYMYVPKLALSIGGRPAYAEYSDYGPNGEKSGQNANCKIYTDLYFRYTVQPGDLGLPVKLMCRDGRVPGDGSNTDLDLLNVNTESISLASNPWKLGNFMPTGGRLVNFHFGPEDPAGDPDYPSAPHADGPHRNYSLANEGIYVQTIDFDPNYADPAATPDKVWREVYPNSAEYVLAAPKLEGVGPAVVYVWSENAEVFDVYGEASDIQTVDGTNYLKVVIGSSTNSVTFRLKGGTAEVDATAKIFMGPATAPDRSAVGDLLEDTTIVRTIRMANPPAPNVKVTFDTDGLVTTKKIDPIPDCPAEELYDKELTVPIYVTLSETFPSDFHVLVKVRLTDDPTCDVFTNRLIGMSAKNSSTGYLEAYTNIEVKAGARQFPVYLYPIGANEKTLNGITLSPEIVEEAAKAKFAGDIAPLIITLRDVRPTVVSPTAEDSLSADKKTGCAIPIEVRDCYRDLNDPQTYTVEYSWDAGTGGSMNSVKFRAGQTTTIVATGFSSKATKVRVRVIDAQGNYSQWSDYIPVLVEATKTVRPELVREKSETAPAVDELVFAEGETVNLRFRLEPETAASMSDMYAFLVPMNEASSNLVTSSAFTEGVLFPAESPVSKVQLTAALRFLDGCATAEDLRFSVMLRTEDRITAGSEITDYVPQTMYLSVTNALPRVLTVEKSNDVIPDGGEGKAVAAGVKATFKATLDDVSVIDITNKTPLVTYWYVADGAGATEVFTVTSKVTGVSASAVFEYTFQSEGEVGSVQVAVRDKDMTDKDFTLAPRYSFTLPIQESPYIYFTDAQGRGLEEGELLYYDENTTKSKGYINVNLSEAPGSLTTKAKPLKIRVGFESWGADGNVTSETDVVEIYGNSKTAKLYLDLKTLDGGQDTMYNITAEVLNTTSNSLGVAWKDYYVGRESQVVVYNVDPKIASVSSATLNLSLTSTNTATLNVEHDISWQVSDIVPDVTNGLKVSWSGSWGFTRVQTAADMTFSADKKTASGTLTKMAITAEGYQSLSMKVEDKDGGYQEYVFWYYIMPTKKLIVAPFGPVNSTQTKYADATGRGKGRVFTETDRTTFAKWRATFYFDVTADQAELYAYGYPAGADIEDNGSLVPAGYDIAIGSNGGTASKTGPYYKPRMEYDSFFYCWVDLSDGGAALLTSVNGVPNPAPSCTNEAYATATLDRYEEKKSGGYATKNIEAIFARELYAADNMGDINLDGIPDLYARKFKFYGDPTTVPTADLEDFSGLNADEDYLPSTETSVYGALIPGLQGTWVTEGEPFDALTEIRGYHYGLNDAMAEKLADGTRNIAGQIEGAASDRVYEEIVDGVGQWTTNCTISYVEYLAWKESGLPAKSWSPERPTNPTKVDTDNDGLPDGYEYFFWYRAHVGWLEGEGTNAVHRYLTGRKYNPANPAEPIIISSEEIEKLMDPIVAGDKSTVHTRDTDNDGLPDEIEFQIGTNPFDYDTDGDELPDGYEVMLRDSHPEYFDPLKYATDDIICDADVNIDLDMKAEVVKPMQILAAMDAESGAITYVAAPEGAHYGTAFTNREIKAEKPLTVFSAVFRDTSGNVSSNSYMTFATVSTNAVDGRVVLTKLIDKELWLCIPDATITNSVDGAEVTDAVVRRRPAVLRRGTEVAADTFRTLDETEAYYDEIITDVDVTYWGVWKYGASGDWAAGYEYVKNPEILEDDRTVVGQCVAEEATGGNVKFLHYQVYQMNGFDPRTGWKHTPGDVVDSTAYTALDEFLLMPFFHQEDESVLPLGEITPTKARPLTTIWADYTTNPMKPDTDDDGMPDGWELYLMAGAKAYAVAVDEETGVKHVTRTYDYTAESVYGPLFPFQNLATGRDPDGDGLEWPEEYSAVVSAAEYSDICETITLLMPEWRNKRWPTDPWNGDTDDDGLGDGAEGKAFIYGEPDATGSAGGGLDPLSWDTDADGLPDPWEAEFAGHLEEGASSSVTSNIVDTVTGATNSVTTTIREAGTWVGGMDGTVADAREDYDFDGLDNWQEYMTGAVRAWRYDDTVSPWDGLDTDFLATIPDPSNEYAWGQFWGSILVDPLTAVFNPRFVSGQFDNFQPFFSCATNRFEKGDVAGRYYMFADGIYHDLRRPDPRYMVGDTMFNRFTYKPGMDTMPMYNLWLPSGQPIYPTKYICCDPTKPDTDGDGLDDFYEMFHGLNPILGESGMEKEFDDPANPYDLVYESYGGNEIGPWSGKNNYWTDTIRSDYKPTGVGYYDFFHFPWLAGEADADPDGDNIRNQQEGIMPNLQAASSYLHTDPTPLWMTDSTYWRSLPNLYYLPGWGGAMFEVNADASFTYVDPLTGESKKYYFADFPEIVIIELPDGTKFALVEYDGNMFDVAGYEYSFEENEGYDTDHDYLSDFEEAQGKSKSASNPQDFDDPLRRQAMYFDGVDSFLQTPLPVEELPIGGEARQNFLYYTVECWAKPDAALVGEGAQANDNVTYVLVERAIATGESHPADESYLRKNFQIGVRNGRWYTKFDSTGTDLKQAVEITDGPEATTDWAYVAATYDGTELKLYVNGVCRNKKATSIQPEHGINAAMVFMPNRNGNEPGALREPSELAGRVYYTDISMLVGAGAKTLNGIIFDLQWRFPLMQTTVADYSGFFKGYIDEVRIWDGARSATDISADWKNRTRYNRDLALENRDLVYSKWVTGATRAPIPYLEELPPQLMYHWSFDHVAGAVRSEDLINVPAGFSTKDNVVDAKAIWSRPKDWSNLWLETGVHPSIQSKVFTDFAWTPWIADTVNHLPRFDRTTLDSVYWSEDFAGGLSAAECNYTQFSFARRAEPYSQWSQLTYLKGPVTQQTRINIAEEFDLVDAYDFTHRDRWTTGFDLIPLGHAYPRRISDAEGGMWDGKGPADAWGQNGNDADNNGLPDWWEEYARNNYCEDLDPTLPLEWDTTVTYNGVEMPAWQAYQRDLAKGLLPDGKYHEEFSVIDRDSDGDNIPDWWEEMYGVQTYSPLDAKADPDHDGLSNLQEYRIGEKAGLYAIDPKLAYTFLGQDVTDYFLRTPDGRYLGEAFADHDFMEDNEEDEIGTDRTLYDAWSDHDEDGWSAYSEMRYSAFKATRASRFVSHIVGDEEVKDFPVPVIRTTLRYNGAKTLSNSNAAIVVEAYSGNNLQKAPNAFYRIVPGSTEERTIYLGAFEDRIVHGTCTPGFAKAGIDLVSLQYAFVQGNDKFSWTVNAEDGTGQLFTGTYKEMLAAYKQYGYEGMTVLSQQFEWTDINDPVSDLRAIQVSVDDKTQKGYFLFVNERLGEIDFRTGDFWFDMGKLKGWYMETGVALEQCFFRLQYTTQIPTLQTRSLTLSLADADAGNLTEGMTAFVAYMDTDGDGAFTPETDPIGFVRDVEVGWDKVPSITIEMTDASAAAGKRFAYPDEVGNLRILRTAFNGREFLDEKGEKPVKRRIVFSRDAEDLERRTVYEGDLVTAGKFGLDWSALRADILSSGLQLKDVTEVTYLVVRDTPSVDHIEADHILDTVTVSFPAQQTKPTAVSPGVKSYPIVETARPTFKWTGTDDNTAFMLRIMDASGRTVYTNDMQVLPARDTTGQYVWTAPVFVGTNTCDDAWVLADGSNYTWQVAMFNAKYSKLEDAQWSEPAAFRTALAPANDFTTTYGRGEVEVRYFGPATNGLSNVIVQLYRNADFTGVPAAQTRLFDVDGKVSALTNGGYVVSFGGLESGDYYAVAFIDRNGNVKRDRWETWGYSAQIGVDLPAIWTPAAIAVDAANAEVRSVTVFMEDTDVNQDDELDCLTADESILSAASEISSSGADTTDDDGDGLTADEEISDTYTDKSKWDTDGDLLPDGWEARFADLDPLFADAGTVADGDVMAFATESGVRVKDAAGNAYLLMAPSNVTYRVGDLVTNEHLCTCYDYSTAFVSGTNVTAATYCGVGTNLVGTAATFLINQKEPVTVAYVHAQVYDRFGYSLKTAIPQDGAIHTKPFTALDKYMTARYLEAIGLANEEKMNRERGWASCTLRPLDPDNDRDGMLDGWELYVMFGTNGCGFVTNGVGEVVHATSLAQAVISPWKFGDRALDLDGDGLRNVDENCDGNDPSDPWNPYSVYESLVAEGVIPPTTEKFDDKVRRFGIGESDLNEDWDLDLISNGQEMWSYYIDYANKSALLADINPTNAWSDGSTPDYFRTFAAADGVTNYLGAYYNGAEFIEPAVRRAMDVTRFARMGTRDFRTSGWDAWSTARYSIRNAEKTIDIEGVVSDELMLLVRYWNVIRPGEFTGTTVGEAIDFFHEVWEGVKRILDEEGNVVVEGKGSISGPGVVLVEADAAQTTTQILTFFGGQAKMEETIARNKKDITADEIVMPEPAINLLLKYAGNASYNINLEAYQTSSAYPEYGEQLTAQWNLPAKFDAGVAQINAIRTPALGSLKQGRTRFVAYIDRDGDGRFSDGDTFGMAEVTVGYLGADVSIRLGEGNSALPPIALVDAESNVVSTIAFVRTKVNGEELADGQGNLKPRGVFLRRYWNNVNRDCLYPDDYMTDIFIGVDPVLAEDYGDEELENIESVTYEVIRLPADKAVLDDMWHVSVSNLNAYTYTVIHDLGLGQTSNEVIRVDTGAGNEEITIRYSLRRDVSRTVTGYAGSTEGDALVSFTIPTDGTANTKFWLDVDNTPYGGKRGFALTGAAGGVVILDGEWFAENGIDLGVGPHTVRVLLGNDKYDGAAGETEWSAKAEFIVNAAAVRDGTLAVKVLHPLDALADAKLTVAVYEKADLAEPVAVTNGCAAGETVMISNLRENADYFVAAWYAKNPLDGRGLAKFRMPYDTWGYVTSLGEIATGFEAKALTAKSVPSVTNVVYLQDTDWNDNGIIDRMEDFKSVSGVIEPVAPGMGGDAITDIDMDGVADSEDDDFIVDNGDEMLENDVMAYATKEFFCVRIGTNEETAAWFAVTDLARETTTNKLSGGMITIPRGTPADELRSLKSTYVYGLKRSAPTGLGTNVTFAAGCEERVYGVEYKTLILVHAQVYDEFGFNPNTANASITQENWVNTKAFTKADKTAVAYYLAGIGAIPEPTTDWVLSTKRIDYDYDGIDDGWELYVKHDPWTYADRAADADGDGLDQLHEYDKGHFPTDPWNADTDGDGVTDALAWAWHLKGDEAGRDLDGDGLSNYAEYLITEVFKYAMLDPANPRTDGYCIDYFRKMGDLYFGEIFTDHDQVDNIWEAEHPQLAADRSVFDPQKDGDGDGWDNFCEYRAETSGLSANTFAGSVTNAGGKVVDTYVYDGHPTPAIELTLKFDRTIFASADTAATVRVESYTDAVTPDAVWTITLSADELASGTVRTTLRVADSGYARPGANTFVCYVMEGEGGEGAESTSSFVPGQPYGVVLGVDVGWAGARAEVELTRTNPIFARVNLYDGTDDRVALWGAVSGDVPGTSTNDVWGVATNEFEHVRIVPYQVAGTLTDGSTNAYVDAVLYVQNRIVAEFDVSKAAKPYLSEADFLRDGSFDIDWNGFDSTDFANNPDLTRAVGEVTAVKYRIVFGSDGTVGREGNLDVSTPGAFAFQTLIDRRFETTAGRTTPTELSVDGVVHGAQPTFRWRLDESVDVKGYTVSAARLGCSYTAFQIQVFPADDLKNPVYDSGVVRAPARNAKGEFEWTPSLFAGDQTALKKVFSAVGNWKWRVAMYNSKFRPKSREDKNGWSTEFGAFSTAVGVQQETDDNGYSAIDVSVKYTGPAAVLAKCEDLKTTEGIVRVQAFTTPDFSGVPAAQGFVTNRTALANAADITANGRLVGLRPGTYWIRAYIDSNGNFTKDDWESWGAAKDAVTVRANQLAPIAGLYIEDADTDQDWIPDAYEYVTDGYEIGRSDISVDPDGKIVLKKTVYDGVVDGSATAGISRFLPGVPLTFFENIEAVAQLVPELRSDTAQSTIDALRDALEKNIDPDSVKITSMTVDAANGKVVLTVGAKVTDSIAGSVFSPVYKLPETKDVYIEVYRKENLATAGWGDPLENPETGKRYWKVTITSSLEETVAVPLAGVDFNSGFYKVEIKDKVSE